MTGYAVLQEVAFNTVEQKGHIRVLLLNASYEPLKLVTWKRALILYFQEKVEVVDQYDLFVHSSFNRFQVPCIIRLKSYVKRRHRLQATFSRQNVFRRDEHICQYCFDKFPEKELTLDHVIPVSRGGKKTWENIVTACRKCNQKKANKTPKEARMELLRPPKVPHWQPEIIYERMRLSYPESWSQYISAVS